MIPKPLTEHMTETLRRPWRTVRVGAVEYVAWEDAETVLQLLADEVVALRQHKAEQGKALSVVLEKLCDVVAQNYPGVQELDLERDDRIPGGADGYPLN